MSHSDRGRSSSELLDCLTEHLNSSLGWSVLNTLRSEEVQNTPYMLVMSGSAFTEFHIIADALSITKPPSYGHLKYRTAPS